jgi:hypothetical protein
MPESIEIDDWVRCRRDAAFENDIWRCRSIERLKEISGAIKLHIPRVAGTNNEFSAGQINGLRKCYKIRMNELTKRL